MNKAAKIIIAAPATLLTTLPIIIGVGVSGPDPDPLLDPPVLEGFALEAIPVPPAMNPPSFVAAESTEELE